MTEYYGRRVTSPETFFGITVAGELRLTVFNKASKNYWVTKLGAWYGDYGSSDPTVRKVLYEVGSDMTPIGEDRLMYTASHVPGANMNDSSGGSSYEHALDVSNGPSLSAGMIYAGRRYAMGWLGTSGSVGHSMQEAAAISADNEQFYYRFGLSQPPPSNAGSMSSTTEGHMSVWAVCEPNVAPVKPALADLSPSGFITSTTPTFTCPFKDTNAGYSGGVDCGDRLSAYQIQVRRKSDGVSFWNAVFVATSAEKAADAVSAAYAGTTLVRGTEYEWRIQLKDEFGAASQWSDESGSGWKSFTPSSLGTVTLAGNPTGKTDDNTPDFAFSWTHQTPLSTNAVRIVLYNASKQVLAQVTQASPISKSVASGDSGTITWAETAFGTPYPNGLTFGASYWYAIEGRDTNGVWSGLSALRSFTIDALPSVPSLLAPNTVVPTTSRPLLQAASTDADDTTATGHEVWARIKSMENVVNPSFAVDASSWSEQFKDTGWTYTPSRDTGVFDTTPAALKLAITNAPATTSKLLRYTSTDTIPCVVGETYAFSCRVRKDNANLFVRPCIVWLTSGGAEISVTRFSDPGYTINTWNTVNVSGVAPATATQMKWGLECFNSVTGAVTWNAWIDTLDVPGWQVRSWKQMTYNAESGKFEYQTTSGADEVPDYASYRWDAYSYDGAWYSGGAATALLATKSAEAQFLYALGPVVEWNLGILGDLDMTTASQLVTWEVTSGGPQTHYRVILYNDGDVGGTPVLDSGYVASTDVFYSIPSGSVLNGHQYDATVTIRNNLAVEGTSGILNINVDYTPADPLLNFDVVPVRMTLDPWDGSIQASWDPSTDPAFQYYTVYLQELPGEDLVLPADADSASIGTPRYIIGGGGYPGAELTSPDEISFTYHYPTSGQWYMVWGSQTILTGVDYLESEPVGIPVQVNLEGVSFVYTGNPDVRVALQYITGRKDADSRATFLFTPESDDLPTVIRGASQSYKQALTADLVDDLFATRVQRVAQVREIRRTPGTYSYRDESGEARFVEIGQIEIEDYETSHAEVTMPTQEVLFTVFIS